MFFQESQIESLLNCIKCNKKFDLSNLPKILPCGNNICSNCENFMVKKNQIFKCNSCFDKHTITIYKLPINQVLVKLLELQPNEIHRSDHVEELKTNINQIKSSVYSIEHSLEGSIDKIKEHCLELKNQVQLATESKIQKLNELNEKFINEIDKYEKECCKKFLSKQALDKQGFEQNDVLEMLKKSIELTTKWSNYLNQFKINDIDIESYLIESQNLIKNLNETELNLSDFIFNYHKLKFKWNDLDLDNSALGYLSSFVTVDSLRLNQQLKSNLVYLFDFDTNPTWKLLYRGSIDSFRPNVFHYLCDDYSRLLVLIRTTKNEILGGYTDFNWKSNFIKFKPDKNSFLIKSNEFKTKFIKYSYDQTNNAIKCNPSSGPCFETDDLVIRLDSNLSGCYNNNRFENNLTGIKTNDIKQFKLSEIEVFCLQ